MFGEKFVEVVFQVAVGLPYAERHIECEPESALFVRCHSCKLERNLRLFYEKSRERPPSNRDIHIAVFYSFDNSRRRILLRVIAVQCEAAYILNNSACCQCVRGWRVDSVITDQLDADREFPQLRIVE